jgi:hypothetical protein
MDREAERIMTLFDGKSVSFREGVLRFICDATVTCTDWGVSVYLKPKSEQFPFTVDGAWEILSLVNQRLSAAYVGWSIEVIDTQD